MPYVKVDSRIDRVDIRTTANIKKALLLIAKVDHRTMTNELEYLIMRRHDEIKKEEGK